MKAAANKSISDDQITETRDISTKSMMINSFAPDAEEVKEMYSNKSAEEIVLTLLENLSS